MSYFVYKGKKHTISDEAMAEIIELGKLLENRNGTTLSEIDVGETFKIGDMEFIVLEHLNGETAVVSKGLYGEMRFGDNNNYNGSNVDNKCNEIAKTIENIVGEENLCEHGVDLTANNGMKCYGEITRKVSLLTAERVRRYAEILMKHQLDEWYWLATASGTKKWGTDNYVLCVAPSGFINYYDCCDCNFGLRPFCILKSSIFVS